MLIIKWKNWPIIRIVFAFAGALIIASITLGLFVNKNFLFLAGFIGFMQVFFSITGICPMIMILKKLNLNCKLNQCQART